MSKAKRRSIAVVGGTGNLGFGLAVRLAKNYAVTIGSRDPARAAEAATKAGKIARAKIDARTNDEAAKTSDIVILAIPDLRSVDLLAAMAPHVMGKLVISPIVPMVLENGVFLSPVTSESAAERVAKLLPMARVASAFHTVPSPVLPKLDQALDYDVLVAADSKQIFDEAAEVISSVGKLRPFYAGPLVASRMIEAMTPALLNVSRLNKWKSPSIKLV